MDEKTAATAPFRHQQPKMPPRLRPVVRLLVLLVFVVLVALSSVLRRPPTWARSFGTQTLADKSKLVPLEAHIISKCPDTRDAMRELILPVMQQVADKVDFRLNYIGTPVGDDGIQCKHGPDECMGNIVELCARELYPDAKTNLGFIYCLTRQYREIPKQALVEDCALEHRVDVKALNECATRDDGAHGLELLRQSVKHTASANVTISCTIRLNDEIYCIRDGGKWIQCPNGPGVSDLVAAIEKLHGIHTGLFVAGHGLQGLDYGVESDSLSGGLGGAGVEGDVDDVDVQMVICWLVVEVELQLVGLERGVSGKGGGDEASAHVLQPGNVLLAKVAQGPHVAALDEGEQVQGLEGGAIPVEIG
ncbi:hypothetical protein L249_4102 [Ophiocordyceps polyrhachis-furcata BCC 54312]|uniref:Gamma interferon inducible lysosomal thiol reductase GILT n=1 Tax=Ophiocordyceps polyrhachis-furcata BCC 54312 TaxID=1330021 RepID=A0A367L541_9HYPO|nr:hypothetical protein L249_4102 [Ophiocordyceps polyrhachis-furcata BCC 54312]